LLWHLATSSTDREPTANGRAAQVMRRTLAMCEKAPRLKTRTGLLFAAAEDEGKTLHQRPNHHEPHCDFRDLTFDMSGGPKGAQRPLGRPLDGGVRCRRSEGDGRNTTKLQTWATLLRDDSEEHRVHGASLRDAR
jgi:hypothetical protein